MILRRLAWMPLALLACGDPAPASPPGAAGASGAAGVGGASGAAGAAGSTPTPDPCAPWSAPPGDGIDDTLPDLPILRHVAAGTGGSSGSGSGGSGGAEEPTTLHQLRSTCGQPQLLVLRVEPAWCGPCGARADRFAAPLAPFAGGHLRVETLLYAGPDNAPTTAGDLLAWGSSHPSLPGALARPAGGDPEMLVRGHGTVPVVYLVDARTMRISNVLEAPDEAFLARQVASSLEEVGGPVIEAPAEAGGDLVDGRFDDFSWSLIEQMAAPWVPPPDPSNAHADDPAAAKLGEALFLDPDLAGNNAVSCATCHAENKGFADALPTAKGVEVGTINTPTALASLNRWFFWDGRADSLWAQALGPLENPSETGGSRLHVAHRVRAAHGASYEAIFGPLPPLDDVSRFPPEGKPGDPAHDAMTPADQEAVARVFVGVGKAIAAYERTLRPPKTRLEAYVAGDTEALSPLERNGLVAFLHSGCVNCHHGPALSDGAFHNVLMPASAGAGDRGRLDGVTSWLASPFRKDGPFSDDPLSGAPLAGLTSAPTMLGQMKTPSLRNIARTGPWGHGGTFATLDDVAKHYGQALVAKEKPPRTVGERDAALGGFLGGHNKEIVAFLKVFGE